MGNSNGVVIENMDKRYTITLIYYHKERKVMVPSITKYYVDADRDSPIGLIIKKGKKIINNIVYSPHYSGYELIMVDGKSTTISEHKGFLGSTELRTGEIS